MLIKVSPSGLTEFLITQPTAHAVGYHLPPSGLKRRTAFTAISLALSFHAAAISFNLAPASPRTKQPTRGSALAKASSGVPSKIT